MRTAYRNAFLLVLASILLLQSCTRIGLAYRHLDRLIPWSVSDYLDMTPEQRSTFDSQLREQLSWHCRTQLPGYLAWMDRVHAMVAERRVSEPEVRARLAEAKQAVATVAEEITPSTVEMLRGLNDEQVEELAASFADDRRERKEKYLDVPLQDQIDERAERMQKRLETWMGRLSQAQQARVSQWSASLGAQNQAWLENRAHWQDALLAALKQRDSGQFAGRIQVLLQQRETLWTDAYRQAFATTEQAGVDLFVDLMASASDTQRATLLKRGAALREDFAGIKCQD
jgi:hypothetical protein